MKRLLILGVSYFNSDKVYDYQSQGLAIRVGDYVKVRSNTAGREFEVCKVKAVTSKIRDKKEYTRKLPKATAKILGMVES